MNNDHLKFRRCCKETLNSEPQMSELIYNPAALEDLLGVLPSVHAAADPDRPPNLKLSNCIRANIRIFRIW